MARKKTDVVIDASGRDHGKIFEITEMNASQAEAWASRLLLALAKSGADVPEGFFEMGMAGVAAMSIRAMAGLGWDVAKPLMDEMMGCVSIKPDARHPQITRPLIEDDIEEVSTRFRLRDEVIALHTGFSIAGFISNFRKADLEVDPAATGQDTAISA